MKRIIRLLKEASAAIGELDIEVEVLEAMEETNELCIVQMSYDLQKLADCLERLPAAEYEEGEIRFLEQLV